MLSLEDLRSGETPKEQGDYSKVEEPESKAELEMKKFSLIQVDTVVRNEIQSYQQGVSTVWISQPSKIQAI